MEKRNKNIESKNKEKLNSKEKIISEVAYRSYYPNDREVWRLHTIVKRISSNCELLYSL